MNLLANPIASIIPSQAFINSFIKPYSVIKPFVSHQELDPVAKTRFKLTSM